MPKKRPVSVYKNYTDGGFMAAVTAVRSGTLSQRKAATIYKIPQATLSDHLRGRVKDGASAGRKPVFSPEVEKGIVQKCADAAEMGLGMSKDQVLKKVGHLAIDMGVKTPFTKRKPGKDWWYGFKSRNPSVTLRSPEKLTNVRARGLNPMKVGEYFVALKTQIEDLNLSDKPECIWNMDEKGASMEHKPSKVVAGKSSRRVPGRVSDSRERNTIVACVNGAGMYMPPLIIVRGKTQKAIMSYNTADGPEGAQWTFQENAWTSDVLGVEWFENIFLKKCGEQRPQLLILDGHHSHEVLGLIEKAMDNEIVLLTLPPHTTHYLCPLDRCVFGPMNHEYDKLSSDFCQKPGNAITKITWPGIFRKAFDRSQSCQNIVSGFRSCGIIPWNPLQIPASAFLPSTAFDTIPSNPNEHPLQWVVRKIHEKEHTQLINENRNQTQSNSDNIVPNQQIVQVEVHPIPGEVAISTESASRTTTLTEDIIIEAPGSPDDPHFTSSLSAEVLLPVVDDETREAVETLISLENAGNEDIVYEVSLNTSDLENTCLDLPINPNVFGKAHLSGTQLPPTTSISADWNSSLNELFSVAPPPPKKVKCTKKLTGHRLLTSSEVIEEKRKQEEIKRSKEQKRLKIKELTNAKKLLDAQIKMVRSGTGSEVE